MTLQKVKTLEKATCTVAWMPPRVRTEKKVMKHKDTRIYVPARSICLDPLIFEISSTFLLFLILCKTPLILYLSCLSSCLLLFFLSQAHKESTMNLLSFNTITPK